MGLINRFPGGGGGSGGIGTTMVISRSHEGTDAPLTAPLQVGYYQDLVMGEDFGSISLKEQATGDPVAVARSIADRDRIQLDDFYLRSDTQYEFEVPVGAVKDKLGNVLRGVYRYSFTTGTYQPILLVTPEATKAAFDAVIAEINTFGGLVYFTEGEFRGLFPITITHSDVTLKGEGANTKIICDTPRGGTPVGVIGVTGTEDAPVQNVTIESMTVDGDNSSDPENRKYNGIHMIYVQNSTIRNVVAQNNNHGIYFNQSSNNTITGNAAQNNDGVGISLCSFNNNAVTGNTVQNNGNSGIVIDASSNNTVSGNTVQSNGYGVAISGSSTNNTITGNIMQNNARSGINLSPPSTNNTVTGNTAQNNGGVGIVVVTSSNTVTGNTAQNNTGGGIKTENSNNNIILANKSQSYSITGTGNINSQNITAT